MDGKIVFVPGALPGETVEVRLVLEKPRFAKAQLVEVVRPSPHRRQADCEHELESGCGGCGFRHVADDLSLELKAQSAFSEIAKLAPEIDLPTPLVHSVEPLDPGRWRLNLHVQGASIGLFKKGSHDLVQIPSCPAVPDELLRGVAAIEETIISSGEKNPPTMLVEQGSQGSFAFWRGAPGDDQVSILEGLVSSGPIAGVACSERGHVRRFGREWIEEPAGVAEHSYILFRRPGTFAQANPSANQDLCDRVYHHLEEAKPKQLLELYAGSGNLTLLAALVAGEVTAVEINRYGIEGLRKSAESAGIENITISRQNLERGLGVELVESGFDTVLLDPPRTGAAELMSDLVAMAPDTILYISCSPPHLARDAKSLGPAYRLTALEAFDMFPRTPHLELLARFQKIG